MGASYDVLFAACRGSKFRLGAVWRWAESLCRDSGDGAVNDVMLKACLVVESLEFGMAVGMQVLRACAVHL